MMPRRLLLHLRPSGMSRKEQCSGLATPNLGREEKIGETASLSLKGATLVMLQGTLIKLDLTTGQIYTAVRPISASRACLTLPSFFTLYHPKAPIYMDPRSKYEAEIIRKERKRELKENGAYNPFMAVEPQYRNYQQKLRWQNREYSGASQHPGRLGFQQGEEQLPPALSMPECPLDPPFGYQQRSSRNEASVPLSPVRSAGLRSPQSEASVPFSPLRSPQLHLSSKYFPRVRRS